LKELLGFVYGNLNPIVAIKIHTKIPDPFISTELPVHNPQIKIKLNRTVSVNVISWARIHKQKLVERKLQTAACTVTTPYFNDLKSEFVILSSLSKRLT